MFFFSQLSFYFVCLVHHPHPSCTAAGRRGSGEYLTSHCTLPAAAAAPAPLSFWGVCFIAALNKGKERAAGWIRAQLPRAELCASIVRINVGGGGLSLAGSFLLLPRFCMFFLLLGGFGFVPALQRAARRRAKASVVLARHSMAARRSAAAGTAAPPEGPKLQA